MQGFNMGRYVPPDLEGTTSGNKPNRPRGILTVRFEMPFPVWCAHCAQPTIIGQGVRFNAEKKRAGSYYTTPVWSFRFRHADCGGWIEMRTDPKNTAYVVVEGATRRNTGADTEEEEEKGDKKKNDDDAIVTDQEREALRRNAFASLEKTIADRERLELATQRIDDLEHLSSKHWHDPYAQNQRLRRAFRVGRKEREKAAAATEALKDRMGLGMELDLLPERELDVKRAALVDFGGAKEGGGGEALSLSLSKPLFPEAASTDPTTTTRQNQASRTIKKDTTRSKADREASRRKETFVAAFISNTRAARDPFLGDRATTTTTTTTNRVSLGIVKKKRKRSDGEEEGGDGGTTHAGEPEAKVVVSAAGLVEYDSD